MLRRLSSDQQQEAIVQGANVRNTKQEVAADLEGTGYFVEDPKDFLGVLKDLIGDNQVRLAVRQWQRIALNISHVNLIGLARQGLGVFFSAFHGNEDGLGMEPADNFKISSRTCSQIHYDSGMVEAANKVLNDMGTIGFSLVRKPASGCEPPVLPNKGSSWWGIITETGTQLGIAYPFRSCFRGQNSRSSSPAIISSHQSGLVARMRRGTKIRCAQRQSQEKK